MAWSSTIRSKFTPNLNRHWKPNVSGRENSSIIKVEIYVWYWKRMLVMQKTKNWKTQPQVNFIISVLYQHLHEINQLTFLHTTPLPPGLLFDFTNT